jgi:glycosyltransferase involved in cell wall biosynthesis
MLTTFFGAHSFGGDAAYVDRLSRALVRHGHEVHVVHCLDSFEVARGDESPRPFTPHPDVVAHPIRSLAGRLSPLVTHQTGRPFFKARAIRRILDQVRPDVVHFHNLSLIGGPSLLGVPAGRAVKFMTTHEHWLVCPLSVLWKRDAELCEKPECIGCCLQARRPPQWWRASGVMTNGLAHLDALICPSRSTRREHRRRGLTTPTVHLPYFLPHDYTGAPPWPTPRYERPYFVAAGRLEKIKGFQDAIHAMRRLPGLDLRVAGSGAFEAELRAMARGLTNVHFAGRLDAPRLAALFRGAVGVVVPSLVYETFGYVVLEAFAEGTPVVARDLGALPELVETSGGGLLFRTTDGLVTALDRLASDPALRRRLGASGRAAWQEHWSESVHLDRYFALIERHQRARRVASAGRLRPAHDAAVVTSPSTSGPQAASDSRA